MIGLTGTLYMVGYIISSVIFPPLSDVFGRKWVFLSTLFMYFLFTFSTSFLTKPSQFWMLCVGLFLYGFSAGGRSLIGYFY
jgi:MFS family permease